MLATEAVGDDEVADGVEDMGDDAAGDEEEDGADEAAAAVEAAAAAAAAAEEEKHYKHSRIAFNPAAAPQPTKITVVKPVSSASRSASLPCQCC